jgi:hypothetical protein
MPDAIHQLSHLITRRPFRRSSLDDDTLQDIVTKVTRFGVRFSIPFGGYKSSWLPNSPHINWAEILWLDYLRHYAEPMLGWIDQDIEFAFSYMSGVLGFINGTSSDEQETYLEELGRLMQIMSGEGVRFRLVDVSERLGGSSKALSQVMANYERLRSTPPVLPKSKLVSASRNCHDLTQAADAALRCEAMEIIPARRAFNKFGEHIQLTHVRGASLSVHIGSCRSSIVQPWVGMGVFERRKGAFVPRILGRSGFESKRCKNEQPNLSTLGLSTYAVNALDAFPHLRRISVIEGNSVDENDV